MGTHKEARLRSLHLHFLFSKRIANGFSNNALGGELEQFFSSPMNILPFSFLSNLIFQ
jgi:hypothetical protein